VPTIDQTRAGFALSKIESVKDHPESAKFASELKDLPARLHSGGLAQTAATFLKKKEAARRTIYGWLEEWLRKNPVGYPADVTLIEAIAGKNIPPADVESRYREASREARAIANWLKKFAEAFLE
jgi:CRISPR type III-B/RAMP module-associated protein Cmr5